MLRSIPCEMHGTRLDKSKKATNTKSITVGFSKLYTLEQYSEIDKWAGNFVITFRSSEAISELRFEIRKFKLRVYQETSDVREKT